jgi:hypothetical protein
MMPSPSVPTVHDTSMRPPSACTDAWSPGCAPALVDLAGVAFRRAADSQRSSIRWRSPDSARASVAIACSSPRTSISSARGLRAGVSVASVAVLDQPLHRVALPADHLQAAAALVGRRSSMSSSVSTKPETT